MSNAAVAQPELELDLDKKRKLTFDFNALCTIEKVVGKNALFDMSLWMKPTAGELRAILWAGLLSDDPNLTLEDTGKLLSKFPVVMKDAVTFAFKNATMAIASEKKSDAESETK